MFRAKLYQSPENFTLIKMVKIVTFIMSGSNPPMLGLNQFSWVAGPGPWAGRAWEEAGGVPDWPSGGAGLPDRECYW